MARCPKALAAIESRLLKPAQEREATVRLRTEFG